MLYGLIYDPLFDQWGSLQNSISSSIHKLISPKVPPDNLLEEVECGWVELAEIVGTEQLKDD